MADKEPVLGIEAAQVYFDGILTEPQLDHPEGLAFLPDGSLLCGGERGQIFRIDPEGKSITQIGSTGGFALGLATDGQGSLYICDLKHAAVFKMDLASGHAELFAKGPKSPNFPVVDRRRGALYVSDSRRAAEGVPAVWRFDLATGKGEPWCHEVFDFANGMALSPDGSCLYVVESYAAQVRRIPIRDDGSPGPSEVFVTGVGTIPDGLAVDIQGNLYISCYEPSAVYRADPSGRLELLIWDPEAHTFCHPTNCAFRGTDLFTANLGRWHITRVPVGIEGLALPV